jgi:hypothetical protein
MFCDDIWLYVHVHEWINYVDKWIKKKCHFSQFYIQKGWCLKKRVIFLLCKKIILKLCLLIFLRGLNELQCELLSLWINIVSLFYSSSECATVLITITFTQSSECATVLIAITFTQRAESATVNYHHFESVIVSPLSWL